MSKQNNLKDYLTDLYAGIVAKKPGASRNPQNFRSEIEAIETEVATFDGTINIESGFTTISGSYIIDEQKAYDLLQTYGKVKTFNVKFSAGGSGSGMGDSIDFTSMTFDGTYGFIKYNDKAAFAMNGGFAEYNNNYGDGNGARVQFEEGTECRKEFKELFLSIADEYVEPEDDSIVGTWIFNENLTIPNFSPLNSDNLYLCPTHFSYTTSDGITRTYDTLRFQYSNIGFYQMAYISTTDSDLDRGVYGKDSSTGNYRWSWYGYANIVTFYDELSDENVESWIKANATKQG